MELFNYIIDFFEFFNLHPDCELVTSSWWTAIASVLGTAMTAVANFFTTKSTNTANQQLAAAQNSSNERIARETNEFNRHQAELQNEWNQQAAIDEFTRNNAATWEMAKYNRANVLADREWEAQYNSPAAQMQRYKDAGLNPNLAYGGASSGTVTASTPQAQPAQFNRASAQRADAHRWTEERATMLPVNLASLVPALSAFSDIRLKAAQADNIKAQTANIDARTLTEPHRRALIRDEASLAGARSQFMATASSNPDDHSFNKSMLSSYYAHQADMVDSQIQQSLIRTSIMKRQAENLGKSGILLDKDINLRTKGLTYNDNLLLRMLSRMIDGDYGNLFY